MIFLTTIDSALIEFLTTGKSKTVFAGTSYMFFFYYYCIFLLLFSPSDNNSAIDINKNVK